MDQNNTMIPDVEYRVFMLELSHQLTSEDTVELKYVLASLIPAGKMESLDTTLKVFRCLEKLERVGPNNLCGLERLFSLMGKHRLSSMVTSFIENN
jgi:hypothetical protein